ncbi:MAG: 16S rRNA (adenine(1518)-N(6)/adenine(1519)-N(6))-dimethyltransferase RsmA [Fidelibacterota bacterium]
MAITHPFRKKWGQHFLVDPNLLQRLVRSLKLQPEDHILEIGPGEGVLTRQIVHKVAGMTVIEVDPLLIEHLKADPELSACRIIGKDVLKLALSDLDLPNPVRIVGNIPYNITTPIIFWLISQRPEWKNAFLMVQKEVGERLTAAVGTKAYSRLTVMVGAFLNVEICFTIPPEVFIPRPRVASAFIHLEQLVEPLVSEAIFPRFSKLVTAAFTQRRKMLKNSLSGFGISGNLQQKIGFSRRPETLSVKEFALLAADSYLNCLCLEY